MNVIKYNISTGEEKTIIIEREIGEGGYGKVYKGLLDGVGYVAVKVQKLNQNVFKSLMTEVEIRSALGSMPDYAVPIERVLFHPFFLKSGFKFKNEFISITETIPKDAAISIFPFAGDLDLFEIIQRHNTVQTPISKPVLIQYIKELVSGLKNLHDHGIAHRDIKPENIMLGDGKLRYIDFGFACFYVKCEGRKGTPYYLAPEMYKEEPISQWYKNDIFSLGNTLFFILTLGENVIEVNPTGDPSMDVYNVMKRTIRRLKTEDLRSVIHDRIDAYLTGESRVFIPLIKGMTDPDETTRMSTEDCASWIESNL